MRRALDFEDEGQRKKGKPRRTWEKQVKEESVKVGLGRCTLPTNMYCWRKSDFCCVEVNLATLTCWGILPHFKHWYLSLSPTYFCLWNYCTVYFTSFTYTLLSMKQQYCMIFHTFHLHTSVCETAVLYDILHLSPTHFCL